jgi:hypothetical protein
MSTAVSSTPNPALSPKARSLTLWAGRAIVAIGLIHVAYFATRTWSRWAGWLAGDLRGAAALTDPTTLDSRLAFWVLPGSFALPLILLGLLISGHAHAGRPVPVYLGWTLGAWVLLGSLILEPSGFPLGIVPTALLIAANRTNPRR